MALRAYKRIPYALMAILLIQGSKSFGQSTTNVKPHATQASNTNGTSGKIEQPVTISKSELTAKGSKWDPANLRDDWYVKTIAADKVPPNELNSLQNVWTLAIIDSGIDDSVQDFSGDLWEELGEYRETRTPTRRIGWNFVKHDANPTDNSNNSHGTHVAGLATARWMGTQQSAPAFSPDKLDPHLKLLIMKVADQDDDAFSATDALAVAVEKGAKVVSASLTLWPDEEADVPMRNAREVLFVVAAGNGKSEIDDDHPVFPPSYSGLDNMITVGASDPDDNVAYFSNYGAKAVHVFAPGAEIMSTVRTNIFGNRYGRLSGTSQATPQVALAAALIWGNLGNLPAKAVKARIMDTSDFVGDTTQKGASGRLNLAKAIMIDHDLMELNDSPHTLLVGTIQNTSVSFAEAGQNCGEVDNNGIRTYDVVDDRVVRVVVENQGSKSVLFSNGGRRTVGTVCDAMIDFLTSDGTTIHKSISDVSDVIWGLWHPHDSGRAQTGP